MEALRSSYSELACSLNLLLDQRVEAREARRPIAEIDERQIALRGEMRRAALELSKAYMAEGDVEQAKAWAECLAEHAGVIERLEESAARRGLRG